MVAHNKSAGVVTQEGHGDPPRKAETPPKVEVTHPHGEVLTAVEVALLNSIEYVTGSVDRTNVSIAETLLDDESLGALGKYAPTFEVMGINVTQALASMQDAQDLMRLERRLELARVHVHRQLAVKLNPISSMTSDVHAVLASLPEGSPMLAAFATHMEQWQKLFAKGGRPAKAPATPADPNAPR
jgi:hypothetical protein